MFQRIARIGSFLVKWGELKGKYLQSVIFRGIRWRIWSVWKSARKVFLLTHVTREVATIRQHRYNHQILVLPIPFSEFRFDQDWKGSRSGSSYKAYYPCTASYCLQDRDVLNFTSTCSLLLHKHWNASGNTERIQISKKYFTKISEKF